MLCGNRLGHIDDVLLINGSLPGVRPLAILLSVHVFRLRQRLVVLDVLLVGIITGLGREVRRLLFWLVAITSGLNLAPE